MLTPYYENSFVKLYCGDCIKVMPLLNMKFNLIVTSPPYNMNLMFQKNGGYSSRYKRGAKLSTKYINYHDDLPMNEYFEFQKEFIEKALKVSDLMFYNTQAITGNRIALFQLLGYYAEKIKDIIIWDKGHGQPAVQSNVLNSQFEFIFCFSNDYPPYRSFKTANFKKGTETNIWKINREYNKHHKAGFPQQLVNRILNDFSNGEQNVLDPFAGSGTTGVVCMERKMHCVLIEKDEEYCKIIVDRLKNKEKEMAERLF